MVINGKHYVAPRPPEETLLERDPESWARFKGLKAMLALPPTGVSKHYLRGRDRVIEIQSTDGRWHRINEAELNASGELVCAHMQPTGSEPVRREWRFDPWVIPAWRTADGFADGEDRTKRATLEPK